MRRGRYYLGRVIKLGTLDQERLLDAIAESATITVGKFRWTITNVVDERKAPTSFIFGRLAKFSVEGHVTVVDTRTKSEVDAIAENLLLASAAFVYLPRYSGIAYLHVWNGIESDVFTRRFKDVIEATYQNFFVNCHIEPVSDYRAFVSKLEGLDKLRELSAKVYPPNPLFGRLWESLNSYIKKRNADEVAVRETQETGPGLNTRIVVLIKAILQNPQFQPTEPVDVTDAAILMAADGYGKGKVVGEQEGEEIVVRTSDTQKSFLFAKEPVAQELAEEAETHFARVSDERDMTH